MSRRIKASSSSSAKKFLTAAKRGHYKHIRKIVNETLANSQADATSRQRLVDDFINGTISDEGDRALHFAAEKGHAKAVKELLDLGADPNVRHDGNETPLLLLLRSYQPTKHENYSEAFDFLIQHSRTDLERGDNIGTPLYVAMARQLIGFAHKLVLRGAKVTKWRDEKSALHFLSERFVGYDTHNALLNAILSHKDTDINGVDKNGCTALHSACRYIGKDFSRLLQHLINHGARPETLDKSGKTALHVLCQRGRGYRYEGPGESHSDVVVEIHNGIDLLLQKSSPDAINAADRQGFTPLLVAVSNESNVCALKLLEHSNIDVNAKTRDGKSPLHTMCCRPSTGDGDDKMMQVLMRLIKKGADINERDREGNTPLHLACSDGYKPWEITELLLKQEGINLHAVNQEGLNPLMTAAKSRKTLDFLFNMISLTGGAVLERQDTGTAGGADRNMKKRSHDNAFIA